MRRATFSHPGREPLDRIYTTMLCLITRGDQLLNFWHTFRRRSSNGFPEIAKLRPHSGRATLITELMGEGLTTALSMKHARHAPGSYKVHLKYGRLTLQDTQQACDATRGSSSTKKTKLSWAHMSSKDLLQCQKDILKEITRRDALKRWPQWVRVGEPFQILPTVELTFA